MRLNPEIQRYLWEDFTLHRTIAMPAVILAVVLMLYLIHSSTVGTTAAVGFYIIAFFWGGAQAAGAVAEEINANTWDNHRLSPASPRALSFGKLFGSTLYAWYGGVIMLAVYIIAAIGYNADAERTSSIPILYNVVLMVGAALLCQSVALLSSIQTLHMRTRYKRLNTLHYLIYGLLVSQAFFSLRQVKIFDYSATYKPYAVQWFGMELDGDMFSLCSLFAFLTWALVGIVRTMREELKLRSIPWVWGLFLLFLMLYCSGFDYMAKAGKSGSLRGIYDSLSPQNFGIAFLIGLLVTYGGAFTEILTITRYRMLHYYWQRKNWRKVGELIPRWAVSFALMVLAGLGVVVTNSSPGFHTLFIAGVVLFMLRDFCLLHYFLFARNNRRAYFTTFFYLAVLYALVPGLLTAMHYVQGAMLFLPIYRPDQGIGYLLAPLMQLGIAAWLLKQRWKRANLDVEETKKGE